MQRGNKMHNIRLIRDLITKEESQSLVSFAESVEKWEYGGSDFWDDRSLNAVNVYQNLDKNVGKLLYDIRLRMKKAIQDAYMLDREVFPDLTQIVRWFPGMEQPPHADDMTNTEDKEIIDNFGHRHFGAILYLNEDYSGGHTYYPQHDFEVKPEAGALAVHPGSPDHMHGVTKVEEGMRYTIASFWSFDPNKYDNWVIEE